MNKIKNFFEHLTLGVVAHFVITWVLPLLTTIIAFLSGFKKYDWFVLIIGTLAAFAFSSIGLLNFSQWLYQRRIKDKIGISSISVSVNGVNNTYCLGIHLNNSATFPIAFKITKFYTVIGTTIPKSQTLPASAFTIPPLGIGWYVGGEIALPPPLPAPGSLEGIIEYTILYGKPGSEKYELHGKKQVIINFNDQGMLLGASCNDAI